jgi:hypothetical protein
MENDLSLAYLVAGAPTTIGFANFSQWTQNEIFHHQHRLSTQPATQNNFENLVYI